MVEQEPTTEITPEGVASIKKRAEDGDSGAQALMGVMLFYGLGGTTDYEEAAYWLLKPDDLLSEIAQFALGSYFFITAAENPKNRESNWKKAFYWCRRAAEQNYHAAKGILALLYNFGYGVKKDEDKALSLYIEAAENGYEPAQLEMGRRYSIGDGVEEDWNKARALLQPLAQEGDPDAQREMGWLVESEGRGFDERNYWYRLAADGGDLRAQQDLALYYENDDDELWTRYTRLAAKQGDQEAQNDLENWQFIYTGPSRLSPDGGLFLDYDTFEKHWKDIAETGDARDQYKLAFFYSQWSDLEMARSNANELAQKWLHQAAENGDEFAIAVIRWKNQTLGHSTGDIEKQLDDLWETMPQIAWHITVVEAKGVFDHISHEVASPPKEKLDPIPLRASTPSLKEDFFKVHLKRIKAEMIVHLGPEVTDILFDGIAGTDATLNLGIQQLIDRDECQEIEFKETFSFNTQTSKKTDDNVRFATLREITGFLNSNDGVLIIGVRDPKNRLEGESKVPGIEVDGFEGDKDKYSRMLFDIIKQALGFNAASFVNISFETFQEKTVCRIACRKSDRPVYCDFKNFGHKPFVRIGSQTCEPPHKEWDDWRSRKFGQSSPEL